MAKFDDLATIFGFRRITIREKNGESAQVEVIKTETTAFPCPVCQQPQVVIGQTQLICRHCGFRANWERPEHVARKRRGKTVTDMVRDELVKYILLPVLGLGMVVCVLMWTAR